MPSHGAFDHSEESQDHSARATEHAENAVAHAEEAITHAQASREAALDSVKHTREAIGIMDDPATITAVAGQHAQEDQSPLLRRKDTLTALAVLVGYVVESSARVDWTTATGWAPAVAVWGIAIIGIGIHAFTKGAITPSVVERITAEAENLTRRKL